MARPMQPLFVDKNGCFRFQQNAIVRFVVDEASAGRKCDLNRLAMRQQSFSQEDWEQFNQLIGYSLKGYHELSVVSDESALAASEAAKKLDPAIPRDGCREYGCFHNGVQTAKPGEPPPVQYLDGDEA